MILIGIGANLPSAHGAPRATCDAALDSLEVAGVLVSARSHWYRSAAVPPSAQPDYVNAVVRVETDLGPYDLLMLLHRIEDDFGRVRTVPNAARVLDLDLLTHGRTVSGPETGVILPHPRLGERAFVLLPMAEVAPDWRHPLTGASVAEMIAAMPVGQSAVPMA